MIPPFSDRLLDHRIVLAGGYLDGRRASELSARLMSSAGQEPITLHLRTPDADLSAAFAVADAIGVLACPVHAVVAGQVGGPALAVLAAARRRLITPNATLLLSEPRAKAEGDAADVAARERELRGIVDAFYIRLADVTGREVDEIRDDSRPGRLLTAEQAVAYGLVQEIAA